jgi:3-isopropylmalate dehydratase small subunit
MPELGGRTWVLGDNVNTDVLHPPQFYSLDPERVKLGLFKGIDETLQARVRPGDFILGGRNFGCGSSRETSIQSLRLNGIAGVVAVDFARIFFRSATNFGIPCLSFVDPDALRLFRDGGDATLDLERGVLESGAGRAALEPVGAFIQRIWRAGGLLGLLAEERRS